MPELDKTLDERRKRYGTFEENARISQDLKAVMALAPKWSKLDPDQREALTVIAQKISRILVGDSSYADNWHDIAGYATLVESRLLGTLR
jgi:hypothetical protein